MFFVRIFFQNSSREHCVSTKANERRHRIKPDSFFQLGMKADKNVQILVGEK